MLFTYGCDPNNVGELIASINTSKASVLCYTYKRKKYYQINVFCDGYFYDFISEAAQKLFNIKHINKGKAIAPHLNVATLKWHTNNKAVSEIIGQAITGKAS